MLEGLSRNWWLIALRGALAVLFGILALVWPGITLAALVFLYGAYAIVDGGVSLWAGITGDRAAAGDLVSAGNRWWLAIVGVVGILAGIVAFVWPGITAFVLITLIGAWAIVVGVMQVVAAIRLRREISDEWLLGLSGVLSVLFGAFVLINPGGGALAVTWLIGLWAIVFGMVLIALGFRVRGAAPRPRTA